MSEKLSRKRKNIENPITPNELAEIPSAFFEYDTDRSTKEREVARIAEEARLRVEKLKEVEAQDLKQRQDKLVAEKNKEILKAKILNDISVEDSRDRENDFTARKLELEFRLKELKAELATWNGKIKKILNPERKFFEQRLLKTEIAEAKEELEMVEKLEDDKLALETGKKVIDFNLLNKLGKEYSTLVKERDEAREGVESLEKKKGEIFEEKCRIAKIKLNLLRREIATASKQLLDYSGGDLDSGDVEIGESDRNVKKRLAEELVIPEFEKQKEEISKEAEYVLAAVLIATLDGKKISELSEKERGLLFDHTLEIEHDKTKKLLLQSMGDMANYEFSKTGIMIGQVINRRLKSLIKEVLIQEEETINTRVDKIISARLKKEEDENRLREESAKIAALSPAIGNDKTLSGVWSGIKAVPNKAWQVASSAAKTIRDGADRWWNYEGPKYNLGDELTAAIESFVSKNIDIYNNYSDSTRRYIVEDATYRFQAEIKAVPKRLMVDNEVLTEALKNITDYIVRKKLEDRKREVGTDQFINSSVGLPEHENRLQEQTAKTAALGQDIDNRADKQWNYKGPKRTMGDKLNRAVESFIDSPIITAIDKHKSRLNKAVESFIEKIS